MKFTTSSMWRFWNASSKAEAVRHFNSMSRRWKNVLKERLKESRYD